MKVIFLDFDGVLVNRKSLYALKNLARGMEGRPSEIHSADPDCVAALNLLAAEDMRIVVSSTWRLDRGRADLRGLLIGWGVTIPVIDKTPRLIEKAPSGVYLAHSRGAEIQAWMDSYDRVPVAPGVLSPVPEPEWRDGLVALVGLGIFWGLIRGEVRTPNGGDEDGV